MLCILHAISTCALISKVCATALLPWSLVFHALLASLRSCLKSPCPVFVFRVIRTLLGWTTSCWLALPFQILWPLSLTAGASWSPWALLLSLLRATLLLLSLFLTSDSFGIPSTILFPFPLRRFPPFRAFAHLLFLMLFLYVFWPRLLAPLTAFTLAFPTLLSTTGTFNLTLFHTSLFLGAGTSRSGCPLLPVQTLNGGWGAIFTSHLLLYLPSLPLIVWRPMLASWVGVPSHILPCSLRVDGALRSLVFTSTTLNSLLSSWASRPSSKAVPISPFLSYVIIFPPLDILIAWVVLSLDSSALWHWRFGITAWPILFS